MPVRSYRFHMKMQRLYTGFIERKVDSLRKYSRKRRSQNFKTRSMLVLNLALISKSKNRTCKTVRRTNSLLIRNLMVILCWVQEYPQVCIKVMSKFIKFLLNTISNSKLINNSCFSLDVTLPHIFSRCILTEDFNL